MSTEMKAELKKLGWSDKLIKHFFEPTFPYIEVQDPNSIIHTNSDLTNLTLNSSHHNATTKIYLNNK